MEKVSIIIPHLNEHSYLNIFLQSIKVCSELNDYEIIIVDNNSEKESLEYLEKIAGQNIKVIYKKENIGFTESLYEGLEHISNDSDYLAFSHSDNVVLHKTWLDYLIGLEIGQPNHGATTIGPAMKYVTSTGRNQDGPHYNFLFTKRSIFEGVGRFQYRKCKNVGLILGYQQQLESYGKKMIMVSPNGFMHHYNLGKISQEEKNNDIRIFNQILVDKIKNIS